MASILPADYFPASHWQQQAQSAFTEWTQSRPASAPPISPAACKQLIAGIGELLGKSGSTNLDLEDIRHALNQASQAVACCVDAAGPNRAAQGTEALIAQLAERGFEPPSSAGRMMLTLVSHADAELAMDELTLILETLQQHLGSAWELTFGHGDSADLRSELRLTLLVSSGPDW